MLWLALAVMTGLAVVAVIWPLGAQKPQRGVTANEADFYRAQLEEIQRDVERGALPADEAASARTETARRLIAVSDETTPAETAKGSAMRRKIAAVAMLAFVPVASLSVYLNLGQPEVADQPLATRKADLSSPGGLELAISRIESRLAQNPNDVRGWKLLAPVYMRLGRYADAAPAYKQILRIEGDKAETEAAYGEALLAAAGGVVTTEARAAFEQALKLRPDMPMARFYLALAVEQDGDKDKALAVYRELQAKANGSEPWMAGLQNRLEALGEAPKPQQKPKFSPDQQAMIQQMVAGLDKRLHDGGGSAEEWGRLIRAYSVLQDPDKAKFILAEARKAYASDTAALGRFDALAQELGL